MVRCVTITALLIFFSIVSVHAQTLDSALAYFPLSIGNLWEYSLYIAPPGTHQYYTFSVVGDTLMPNGRGYRQCNGGIDQVLWTPVYLRIDSSTGTVWQYDSSRASETEWDSLRARPEDRLQYGAVTFSSNMVFGVSTPVRTRTVGYQLLYQMAYGIGLITASYMDLDAPSDFSNLVYAKINGKEYGTFLSLPPMVPTSPGKISLSQNYPNPFNPSTTIRYSIPQRTQVALTVFNTLGQQVATLVNEIQDAGYHDVKFDGSGLASGVYIYRLQAGDFVQTKRSLLLK